MPVLSFQSKVSRHYHRAGHCDLPSLRARASRLTLGWQNTRYKNPQLVAQNCFGASFGQCFPFFTVRNQLVAQQKHLKKVVAKSRVLVYFVQQILALLLVFHQTHDLARNKFARALANQPIRALHFLDLRQTFLLRIKLIMQGEKRETSTKTCNETMLYLVFRRLKLGKTWNKYQVRKNIFRGSTCGKRGW